MRQISNTRKRNCDETIRQKNNSRVATGPTWVVECARPPQPRVIPRNQRDSELTTRFPSCPFCTPSHRWRRRGRRHVAGVVCSMTRGCWSCRCCRCCRRVAYLRDVAWIEELRCIEPKIRGNGQEETSGGQETEDEGQVGKCSKAHHAALDRGHDSVAQCLFCRAETEDFNYLVSCCSITPSYNKDDLYCIVLKHL